MPIEWTVRNVPSFVLLGDGRVIVGGAVPAIFPGPAMPPLNERTLTPEGVQTILQAVEETGLFTSDLELRGAQNIVADAADTVFELHAAGRDVTITVYGLGLVSPDMELPQGMTSAELEAHRLLTGLNDALLTIDTSVPADQWEADGWQPYEPEALRLYVRDASGDPVDAEVPPDVRDWPGTTDPGHVRRGGRLLRQRHALRDRRGRGGRRVAGGPGHRNRDLTVDHRRRRPLHGDRATAPPARGGRLPGARRLS